MDGKFHCMGSAALAGQPKKGQLVSTELVICISIFMAALVIFLLSWTSISASYYEEQADRDMEVALIGISDMAVLSPGSPPDWESTTVTESNAFGFARSRNVLSPNKLAALAVLDGYYETVKERMGAGKFGLSITVVSPASGSTLYSFGKAVSSLNTTVSSISAERLALLDDEPVRVKVQVWRQKGSTQY
jgi:hypothetical protein